MNPQHLSGVLPVEKGPGVTSFQVVAHLRRQLRVSKIGHGGTLDPEATGVLPILIGEATKLTPYLTEFDKEYLATVRLGVTTSTQDMTGTVLETRAIPSLDQGAIEATLTRFVGIISQIPPMYSALRRGGRRLYELAREGITVDREPRQIVIHAITLEALDIPELTLRVHCGKGTYVRTLAADLGAALGCGGALASLTRTRVGPYTLASAVSWAEVAAARGGETLWARVLPSDSALAAYPAVHLDAPRVVKFVHGQTVPVPGGPNGRVRVYSSNGACLGVGEGSAETVKPERLLHADPARPSVLPA
ncbi:MAG TPA: tRNA pseudouridine(55) synthase TruB [Candidatus Methylomirabilis sp.]|nr:tRNA pseudouridine(55) synthase TruB [Candidatus Methylomirabilis sp.]